MTRGLPGCCSRLGTSTRCRNRSGQTRRSSPASPPATIFIKNPFPGHLLKGLFTDFGSTEPFPAQEYGLLTAFSSFYPCGQYGRFNNVKGRLSHAATINDGLI